MSDSVDLVETVGGPLIRLVRFIDTLKNTDGEIQLGYRIGMKADTLEPAIGISINGGEPYPFTVEETRKLADLFEQTLQEGREDGAYGLQLSTLITSLASDLRSAADIAEEKHALALKAFVTEH